MRLFFHKTTETACCSHGVADSGGELLDCISENAPVVCWGADLAFWGTKRKLR